MNDVEFFPAKTAARPMIYAYEEDNPKYTSLEYTGLQSCHEGVGVGLYNTVLSASDYAELGRQQLKSIGG